MRANTGGAQREYIPDREIWRPRSSGGYTRHLPQRAVTLTTIVYWLGDLTIPFWEVAGGVTALSTRGAVTGNTLYILYLFHSYLCRVKGELFKALDAGTGHFITR
jgi:hypothetical protein